MHTGDPKAKKQNKAQNLFCRDYAKHVKVRMHAGTHTQTHRTHAHRLYKTEFTQNLNKIKKRPCHKNKLFLNFHCDSSLIHQLRFKT